MIEAVKSGLDVWVQKPISVDVVEGQAMLAAARKYKRVVQVGMQRRSTPHLVTRARSRRSAKASSARSASSRSTATTTCGRPQNPPDTRRPTTSTTRCGPGRRRCGPTTRSSTRAAGARSWNTATASSATCACTCSTWCAGCSTSACRRASAPSGGILVDKASKANITDTQTATFDFRQPAGRLDAPHRTATRPIRSIRGARRSTATRARSRRASWATTSCRRRRTARRFTRTSTYELEQFPEDKTEKDLETHVAPAIRAHMKNFLACIEIAREAGRRTSSRATCRRPRASSPTCR